MALDRRCFLAAAALPLAGCALPPRPAGAPGPSPLAAELHALFDAHWEASMRRYPEWATYVGDDRYGDRWQDASPAAEAAHDALLRRELAAAESIASRAGDGAALGAVDRVSLEVFRHELRDTLAFAPFTGFRRMTLGARSGFHTELVQLMPVVPVRTEAQAEQLLARFAAWPARTAQELHNLREGLALGWVPPPPVLARVRAAIDVQLAAEGERSPFLEPFQRLGSDIPPPRRGALRERAQALLEREVKPALRRLRDFVDGEYAARAPAGGQLASYPGGPPVYAALVRSYTTTEMSPAEVHALGRREVARLRAELDAVMKEMRFGGDYASFVQAMESDPKHQFADAESLLAAYRDIGKRIDAELPRLFAELPRTPWGVRPMPEHMGPDAAEFYTGPPLDGSRPGWFNANVLALKARPRWAMETLTAHEAVPGHHLQVARAIELGELPRFRRALGYVAYSEGWALYAETLGFELGLYKTPESRFGHLRDQMLRAARLVVDTGIHDQRWSRERAIDFLQAEYGGDPGTVAGEIDRYFSWPGQALGYMIGELKIIALREQSRAALGARFDIRRFHNVVLDAGALPLGVLQRQVERWVEAEKARPAPA